MDGIKRVGSLIAKKIILWIGGLLGATGIFYLSIFLLLLFFLVGAIVSVDNMSDTEVQGGNYVCSPTGDINKGAWDSQWSRMGVLKDYGDVVIKVSKEKGIDPVLFSSIMALETTWGTSNALINHKNPGGLMDPSTGSKGFYTFKTYEEGIEAMGNTLYNRIIRDGLVTVEKLGNVYAPVGADNDPHNTNSNWIPLVNSISQQFGGLTMNCEPSNEFNFEFDGNVTELRKSIATVGNKWVGKTTYHWGGGRNPQAAARGEYDCSSFVHWAYAENGIELGNIGSVSTETLNKMGTKIPMSEIQVGDLIFWDSYKKDGHVGIYIGNGKFIGSQSSTGVAIESLNHSYWSSIFNGHVRRIIND